MASLMGHAQFSSIVKEFSKILLFATYEFRTVRSVEWVNIMEIDTVKALRRFEPHIVIARVVVLPECSHWHVEQWTGFLTQSLNE